MADGVLPAPQQPQGGNPLLGVLGGIGNAIGSAVSLPFSVLGAYGSEYAAIPQAIALRQAQQRAQFAALQRQMQGLSEVRAGLSDPRDIAMFDADPGGFLASRTDVWKSKNTPQKLAGGESLGSVADGISTTAPNMGMTTSGVGYTQTPSATTITGSLPTIQSAPAGTTVSGMAPIGAPAATAPGVGAPSASGQPLALGATTPGAGDSLTVGGAAVPVLGAPMAPSGAPGPANAPRGIRNNNWGNLTALPNGQQWAGQTGVDQNGYVQFATPQDGLKAAITNLRAYGSHHGIDTIQGIAERWAPKRGGNDTIAYAHNIANAMGVGVNDRLDMTNPQVLNGLVHGISIAENGKHAIDLALGAPQGGGTPAPTPSAPPVPTSAAAPASPSPAGLPTSIQGKTNTTLSPQEAASLGLMGVWQRDPTGKLVQPSPPPASDVKRLADLDAGLDTLHQLQQNQQKFMAYNAKEPTGLRYADINLHNHDVNPLSAWQIAGNPAVSQMHALSQSQVLMKKPGNAGARILQSELPLWREAVQGIDMAPNVNQERLNDTNSDIDYLGSKKAYLNTWINSRGNLNGADEAFNKFWAKRKGEAQAAQPGQTSAPAPGSLPRLSPEDAAKLPSGTPFMTLDGRTLVRH